MQSTTSFNELKIRVQKDYSEKNDGDKHKAWLKSAKATLGILIKRTGDLSIYKVPKKLRRLKEDAYNPHLVSVGPFHVSNQELVGMKKHKWLCMLNFLCRAVPHGTNYDLVTSPAEAANDQGNEHPLVKALEECYKAISKLEEMARACYAENINLDKHQLVEILLVDGCFILELFIKHDDQNQDPTLLHDLALLENQIPYVVLQTLFDTIQKLANKQFRFSLKEYVLLFFRSALNLSDKAIEDTRTRKQKHKHMHKHIADLSHSVVYKHIADLLHSVVYKPTLIRYPKRILEGQEKIEWGFKRSATELVMFGIQFKPGVGTDRRLLDITFSRGVITIPPLYIQEITDSVFRNLIALEQCRVGCSPHMASYAWLMKTLIRSSQDAELLRLNGIIRTSKKVGGDEEVLTFFESLCREVVVRDFCFSDLCEEVNEYELWSHWGRIKTTVKLHWGRIKAAVKVRWNRYIDILHKDYFNSPWSIISFFAAVLLLCLTALQTYYSVRSYYPH